MFGLLVVQARERSGCRDWVEFSKWLYDRTGYKISKTVLHNHSRGFIEFVSSTLLFALKESRMDDGSPLVVMPFDGSEIELGTLSQILKGELDPFKRKLESNYEE